MNGIYVSQLVAIQKKKYEKKLMNNLNIRSEMH